MMKLTKTEQIKIKEVLKARGYPEDIIESDLEQFINGRINNWKIVVADCVENGCKNCTIEEYRHDLSVRDTIQYIIDNVNDENLSKSIISEIKEYDDTFKSLLVETDKCIWKNIEGRLIDKLSECEYMPDDVKERLRKQYEGYKDKQKEHLRKKHEGYKDKQKYFWVWGIIKNAKGELLRDARKMNFNICCDINQKNENKH